MLTCSSKSRRPTTHSRVSASVLVALGLVLSAYGCASGTDDDAGPGTRDTGPRLDSGPDETDSGPDGDGGPVDAGGPRDGGVGVDCGAVTCDTWQFCDSGTCRDFPACRASDGTCDRPGDVCHNRRCIPSDVDIDGDGSPAGEDCDETDPDRYPGNDEVCNMADEDCDETVDEGDPAQLCEFYPGGGICIEGNCGCPPGTFDLDRDVAGCECIAEPPIDQGLSCQTAIDLGNVSDSGQSEIYTGNVMPDDREVWYRFRGTDTPDTSCDNYHVRVQFTNNPDDTFEMAVFKGSCGAAQACTDESYSDYSWSTDFRASIAGTLTGQCPCTASGATRVADRSVCEDDSDNFFVRVRRAPTASLSCAQYSLEISNGLYDTP